VRILKTLVILDLFAWNLRNVIENDTTRSG
jgi:hypothetical protein